MFNLGDFIVRNVAYVDENCGLTQAAKLLCVSGQIILPAVDDCIKPVGVLTEKDILRRFLKSKGKDSKVAEGMHTNFTAIGENAGLIDIVRIFAGENFSQIMVVSEGVLVGLVNRTAIIKYLMDEKSAASRRLNAIAGKV
ncbi:MAG: CBS domain-containing protein [Phycisphaerae bacterium]|nr:CBS domain-containing protein [Phycisphaerae bacterium]